MMTNAYREAEARLLFANTTPSGGAFEDVGSGLQASSTAGSLWLSGHTASPGVSGSQTTSECTWSTYARIEMARGAVDWDLTNVATGIVANANAEQFPKRMTTGAEEILYIGLGTDETGAGNLLRFTPLAVADPSIGIVDITADDDTIYSPNHGLSDNDRVMFESSILTGGSVVAGLSAGTAYYVVNAATDKFDVSTTEGGSAVNITADGLVLFYEVNPITVARETTPTIAAGAAVFKSE